MMLAKRNVKAKDMLSQMTQLNEYFVEDDIVQRKDSNDFGIVVRIYKNYVEFVNNHNQLVSATNTDIVKRKSKNDKRGDKVLHNDFLTRDCIALIEIGPRVNSEMLVKQIYNGYAFMLD